MRITRRSFLKMAAASAAAMGMNTSQIVDLYKAIASYDTSDIHVIWFQGQACSGDSVAFTQLVKTFTEPPTGGTFTKPNYLTPDFGSWGWDVTPGSAQVEDIVLNVIDLEFHPTLMGPAGTAAVKQLKHFYSSNSSRGIVVVVLEGSIPVDAVDMVGDNACIIGKEEDGTEITLKEGFTNVADQALAVVAVGQCATFGGVPKAASDYRYNRSGALSAQEVVSLISPAGNQPPVVNVPGCPANGWWIFNALVLALYNASTLNTGTLSDIVTALDLDEFNRPRSIYGSPVHGGDCSRYQDYLSRIFQTHPGDYIEPLEGADPGPFGEHPEDYNKSYAGGCLKNIGCKGMSSFATCAKTFPNTGQLDYAGKGKGLWCDDPGIDPVVNVLTNSSHNAWNEGNGHTSSSTNSSCILDNAPCQACTEKGFPDRFSPFVEY